MKKLIVWLDDLRDPSNYGLPDALWLKNSSEFMDFINDKGKLYRRVSEWHMDNDLGEVFEGYDCLSMLEEKFVFGKPPVVDNVKISCILLTHQRLVNSCLLLTRLKSLE